MKDRIRGAKPNNQTNSPFARWWNAVSDSIREWQRHTILKVIFLISALAALLGSPLQSMLASFTSNKTGQLATYQIAYYAGAVFSNIFAVWFSKRSQNGVLDRHPWVAPIILGSFTVIFAQFSNFPLRLTALFLGGGAYAWSRLVAVNYTHQLIPKSHIARVLALYYLFQHASIALAGVLAGTLALSKWGVTGSLSLIGLTLAGISASMGFASFIRVRPTDA